MISPHKDNSRTRNYSRTAASLAEYTAMRAEVPRELVRWRR